MTLFHHSLVSFAWGCQQCTHSWYGLC